MSITVIYHGMSQTVLYVYCVYTAMLCIHKILKFMHKMQKHLTVCFNFHLGVYGAFPVRLVLIIKP